MLKTVWMKLDAFPFEVGFVPDQDAWDRVMIDRRVSGDYSYPSSDGRCAFFEGDKGENNFVLVTVDRDSKIEHSLLNTLVHESVHCFQFLCRSIGEAGPSAEFEAYVIAHIFTFLLEAYHGCFPSDQAFAPKV